jgi:hypothetical protein
MATKVMVIDITEQLRARNERTFVLEVVEKLRQESHLLDGLNAILKYVREYIQWQYGEIWLTDSSCDNIKMITHDFDTNSLLIYKLLLLLFHLLLFLSNKRCLDENLNIKKRIGLKI